MSLLGTDSHNFIDLFLCHSRVWSLLWSQNGTTLRRTLALLTTQINRGGKIDYHLVHLFFIISTLQGSSPLSSIHQLVFFLSIIYLFIEHFLLFSAYFPAVLMIAAAILIHYRWDHLFYILDQHSRVTLCLYGYLPMFYDVLERFFAACFHMIDTQSCGCLLFTAICTTDIFMITH